MLHEPATATGKRIVFYCAFGERSAMAVQIAQEMGSRILAISEVGSMRGKRQMVR
jgi:rhodanese-related sulfurtransferase